MPICHLVTDGVRVKTLHLFKPGMPKGDSLLELGDKPEAAVCYFVLRNENGSAQINRPVEEFVRIEIASVAVRPRVRRIAIDDRIFRDC